MIDIRADILEIIMKILTEHVSDTEVRAFGSRVNGTARKYSDLDLALKGKDKVPRAILTKLEDDFEASDVPFHVDILDWHRISDSFKAVIEKENVVLRKAGKGSG